jgi:hypothetical protein
MSGCVLFYGFGLRRKPGSDRGAVMWLAAGERRYGGGVAPIPFTRLFGTSGRRALESIRNLFHSLESAQVRPKEGLWSCARWGWARLFPRTGSARSRGH